MREDCANGMSAPHGCNNDTAVVENFMEALKQRIGADRFRLWFTDGVTVAVDRAAESTQDNGSTPASAAPAALTAAAETVDLSPPGLSVDQVFLVQVTGRFAADRLRRDFTQHLRGAAAEAGGPHAGVRISSRDAAGGPRAARSRSRRPAGDSQSRSTLSEHGPAGAGTSAGETASRAARENAVTGEAAENTTKIKTHPKHITKAAVLAKPSDRAERESAAASGAESSRPATGGSDGAHQPQASATIKSFIPGTCNELAFTAIRMASQTPGAATPLFLFGPPGIGKTHLLTATADQLRRRHRMRRVIHLSAEQFTNDFIKSVGSSGLPAFRRRYRDVDALLIDDVQFLAAKKATLREMLYTVDTLTAGGRPLLFAANQPPTEIPGLTKELAGRMAAGLVCPLQPLDAATRESLLRREIDRRCLFPWPEESIQEINALLGGDGRLVTGMVNLVGTLQRMFRRMPTMDEILQFGGDMLRSQTPAVTLSAIERAVCEAFDLDERSLRTPVQTRSVTEPRMLAMYLSRQMTSAAYSEIARHYGGRSHSTAIAARRKVESWINNGKSIGRGRRAMSASQAVQQIEGILRAG